MKGMLKWTGWFQIIFFDQLEKTSIIREKLKNIYMNKNLRVIWILNSTFEWPPTPDPPEHECFYL
jgi:hypothetical protein